MRRGGIQSFVKRAVQIPLGLAGLELRRKTADRALPPLIDDPLCALHEVSGGAYAAFRCPIDRIIDQKGFGFGPGSWHPFVAAIRVGEDQGLDAADALLARYYDAHRPRSAAEAVVGFDRMPPAFADMPPELFYLTPWTARTAEAMQAMACRFTERDNAEHGRPDLTFRGHGFNMHGPVHPDKRRLEAGRLLAIADAIRTNGYDRTHGDVKVMTLRRGRDFRYFISGGGYHRTAAVAATGQGWVPARFVSNVFDLADVDDWPQVRRGVWPRDLAVAYVDHLFDHDARNWAARHGLTDPGAIPARRVG